MFKKIKNLFASSLFLKIVAIFILGHILFSISMMGIRDYMFHSHRAEKIYNTAYNYSNLIIEKIGTPPDTTVAAQLAFESYVSIRMNNDTLRWASSTDTPYYRNLELEEYSAVPNTFVGFDAGLHVKTQRNNTTYLISIQKENKSFVYYDQLLMISNWVIFTIVLAFMYWFLKLQLKPIKILQRGVEKVGRGDFDQEIEVKCGDELGKLIKSFNNMNRDVREMIESREQLLLDVSHELRSPITRVKLALEFMQDSDAKESVSSDIKEIETMITEILETERLNSPYGILKKEKINITPLLNNVKSEFHGREPGLKFEFSDAFEIMGDPERLKIVFRNIFENGLKYSANQSKPVEIEVNQSGKSIVIIQRDFGIGIPKDQLKQIFEPFYRVDKSRSKETGGYGLGLHLTKKIIQAHKGEINIESDTNSGTIITISFPAI